jgi:hypothetical protein
LPRKIYKKVWPLGRIEINEFLLNSNRLGLDGLDYTKVCKYSWFANIAGFALSFTKRSQEM